MRNPRIFGTSRRIDLPEYFEALKGELEKRQQQQIVSNNNNDIVQLFTQNIPKYFCL